jgi:hypothetical protein
MATQINPISVTRSGCPGRPRKEVDIPLLREAVSERRKITLTALSEALHLSRRTLRKHLILHGLYRSFTNINDLELDTLLQDFKEKHPKSGLRYAIGYLKKLNVKIQRYRVRAALRRIDQVGQSLRRRTAISRRKYEVARPNSLWHLDGHHKLIRWGFVIHGITDGFSRAVCFDDGSSIHLFTL